MPMQERRFTQRNRTFKSGTILFGVAGGIECIVRNVSEAGACLEPVSHIGIPENFKLLIKPENRSQTCYVVWRSAQRIGVSFI